MSPRPTFSLRAFAAKLRGLVDRRQRDDGFDQEIQEHLQLLADSFVAQGMTEEEAARAARRQFGNITLLQEDRRDLKTLPSIESLWHDLRYGARLLWKDRGFAAVSIGTLGLGIGAAAAIFSVVYNVVLAPFPYTAADRIVFPRIHNTQQGEGGDRQGYRPAEILGFAESNHVFDGVSAAFGDAVLYKRGNETEMFFGARVTPGTFEFFGLPALHGRVMQSADYQPGAPPVFVLRYKTWIERFNGDPSIVSKTFVLNGTARTLVGIMPPRFGWYGADLFVPHTLTPDAMGSVDSQPYWFMVGRLKPDVSRQQAEAELTVIARQLAKSHPQDFPRQFTVRVRTLGDSVVGRIEATLYTVLAAVGLLLLIACSNVANLMLARATTREKEFALRVVLGAGRARLVRLVLVESLMLAVAGAALGIFLAWGGLKALVAALPPFVIPSEAVIELNGPVLAFTLGVAVLTALIFGLAPALQSSRRDLSNPLRDSGKGLTGGFRGRRLRDAVVVVEVALSLTLLIGAGLLMRSFAALRDIDLGFRADHVFQTFVNLPTDRYKTPEQVAGFYRPLLARLKALPGVVDAATSSGIGGAESPLEIVGRTRDEDWRTLSQHVSQEFFNVLRIEFRRGRPFSEAEVTDARRVVVVNEAFVRRYLPAEDPIGQRVRLARLEPPDASEHDPSFEIVGVFADVINRGLRDPIQPEVWIPYTVAGSTDVAVLLVRTSQEPGTIANAVRKEVWAADAGAAPARPAALEDLFNERMYAGPRFGFLLMLLFGCIGLILVTVGVYGVLAYSTAQKTHEIGIRMALGAEASDALGLVVKTGLRLVVTGIALGIVVSLALGRVIGTQLVDVTVYDPPTLIATTLLLTMTAAIACWIPARRAARVDPMVALRCE